MEAPKLNIKMEDANDLMVLVGLMAKRFDRRLIMVVLWWLREFRRLTFTETFRKMKHPHDLHGTDPVRAVDGRSWEFDNPQEMADRCNEVWQYDPNRPHKVVCVYHESKPGANDWHFHIQVHPNTCMRERKQ
jgi:hypothetical protein